MSEQPTIISPKKPVKVKSTGGNKTNKSVKPEEAPVRRSERKRLREDPEEGANMSLLKSPVKRTRKNSIGAQSTSSQNMNSNNQDQPGTGEGPGGSAGPSAAGATGRATPPPIDPGTERLLLAIEKRLSEKMDSMNSKIGENTEGIKGVKKELREDLKKQLDTRDAKFRKELDDRFKAQERKTKEEISRALADIRAAPNTSQPKLTAKQEEDYKIARRSLRLSPIKGPNYAASIRTFLKNILKIPADVLLDVGNIDVNKPPEPKPKIPDEVIVVFGSAAARDVVKAAGKNLAGQTGAGMRIQVPNFLMGNFHALQGLAYYMKQNDQSIQRSIKFDDEELDLVLDVKIEDSWRRVTPAQAKEAARNNPNINAGPREMSAADIGSFFKQRENNQK